jgi:twitching motility protein PilT
MDMLALLALSVERRASDLHLLPELKPLLRIDGVLAEIKDAPVLSASDTQRMIYSLMTPAQQQDFETNLVYEMAIPILNVGNFRASILHQLRGVGAVFRVIPEKVPTFEELQLPQVLKSLLVLSHGLILVTGPTGSGKTTTLAAMIDYINTFRACNIITIEDPIEYVYQAKKSVFSQLQVGRDTPNFATALRASLRQDPNVILLGELRDLETMRLALTAAETGHLVLATLHASSASLAVGRFAEVFPVAERQMVRTLLAETLQAIICQTLVRKVAGGRIAAFEIMLASTAIRHFIRRDMDTHMESTMQTSGDKGMCTLEQYLNELVQKRQITASVAHGIVINRSSFRDPDDPSLKGKK